MMQNAPLDEHVKKRLGDYEPEVPPHIWENIMAQKEKRRPVAFWLNPKYKKGLFFLLGILVLGTSIFLLQHNNSTKLTTGINSKEAFIKNTNQKTSGNYDNIKEQDTKLTS
jgi:hypothetical protein